VQTLVQTAEIPKYKIKNLYIFQQRRQKRQKVEEELQNLYFLKDDYKGTY
jgi:hypothetical protein